MLALLATLLAAPAPAAQVLIQLGRPQPVPAAVYGSLPAGWSAGFKPGALLPLPMGDAPPEALGPAVAVLEAKGHTAESFFAAPAPRRLELLREAGLEAQAAVQAEAEALVRQVAAADPARPEFPLLVARLHMLGSHLVPYLEAPALASVVNAYRSAREKLGAEQSRALESAMRRSAEALGKGVEERVTVVEAVAAGLPTVPSRYLSPRINELRKAAERPRETFVPPPTARFRLLVAAAAARNAVKRFAAARLFRPTLEGVRWLLVKASELWRHYFSGQPMARHNHRWHVIEKLHRLGDFRGSFGHPVEDGTVEVESGIVFPAEFLAGLRAQEVAVGDARIGPMLSISGMSFPQIAAPSVLSLLHNHIALAKQLGVRTTFNTGEGSPFLHLGLLEGDREKVKDYIVDWGLAHARFKPGGWTHANIHRFIDELFAARDALFKDFSPEDLAKAQLVAQFGSGLNGIRGPDHSPDFDALRRIAENPFVAMIQWKLKQAAKRGAKVNAQKLNEVVAAFRDIDPSKNDKGPEIIADLDSFESIAFLIKATRAVTRKPVSIKFGIGRPKDALEFLEALKELDALPDHIQLDGRGPDFSPGSGNAPQGANTSLPSNEAVIVLDALLKKLGVRDRIVVEATGDILEPIDAVEKLALGADCVAAARGWMGMGLGCSMVMDCASGKCPYGITASPESFLEMSLDPQRVGPKGYEAASNWHKAYVQTLAETNATDWRDIRRLHGLASGSDAIRVQKGGKVWTLDEYYDLKYVSNLLRKAMTRGEVRRLVFGRPL